MTFNKDDKNAYIAYGSVLATEGKFDEARQQFEGAAKIDPKDVRPVLLEAQTYLSQNSVALAASLYDRAIAIDPTSVEALVGKARLAAAPAQRQGRHRDLRARSPRSRPTRPTRSP